MPIMLAEDIGGWLAVGLLVLGGIAASVLALGALYPACKGMRLLTTLLIAPALLMGILSTCWLAQEYLNRASHDREEIIENYLKPWLVMALPPLATSVFVGGILLFQITTKSRK